MAHGSGTTCFKLVKIYNPIPLCANKNRRALSLRAIIWRRRKTQGIARPVPSALHLDFFAAAKPLLLGTARGEVTLLLSLDKRKFCAI
jgi:hypothetical protein